MERLTPELIARIEASRHPAGMSTAIVAIDGLGGAGKSTLARTLAQRLCDAPVLHTDDFASWENPLNWWPRLLEQVLEPLARNEPGRYQRYDWDSRTLAEWHEVPVTKYLLIEGVSASRKAFQPFLAFSVWVETSRDERLRRGLERDGEDARAQWDEWMAEENEYLKLERPAQRADLIVSGAQLDSVAEAEA
jgi:uridine kinase